MVIGFNNYFGGANPYMMGMNPMMAGSYMNFKDNKDMKTYFNSQVDNSQADIYSGGQGRISQKAYMLAHQLQGALASENSTEVGNILKSIEGDKHEVAGVELAYDQMVGSRCGLRNDIRNGLEGGKTFEGMHEFLHKITSSIMKPFGYNPMSQSQAIDILNEGTEVNTTTAANAIKEAGMGFGTDEKTIEYVLNHSKGRMAEINASYQQMGCSLADDIREDYDAVLDGFGKEEQLTSKVIDELA